VGIETIPPPLTASSGRANNARVPFGFFAREWERTCTECGYSWRVPRSIARRGIRGMSAMTAHGATAGPAMLPGSGANLRDSIAARSRAIRDGPR
jgi:hypothetical protein